MLHAEHGLCCAGWDADFATEAYRQQVEALAQNQVRLCFLCCFFLLCRLVHLITFFIFWAVDGGSGI